MCSAYSPSNVI